MQSAEECLQIKQDQTQDVPDALRSKMHDPKQVQKGLASDVADNGSDSERADNHSEDSDDDEEDQEVSGIMGDQVPGELLVEKTATAKLTKRRGGGDEGKRRKVQELVPRAQQMPEIL